MANCKTTEDDFREFCKFVADAVEIFGLRDWSITFAHRNIPNRHAQTRYQAGRRVATITLAKVWDVTPTSCSLHDVAQHEVLHVCLADLYTLGTDRYTTERALDDAEEAVVVRLQNAIRRLMEA